MPEAAVGGAEPPACLCPSAETAGVGPARARPAPTTADGGGGVGGNGPRNRAVRAIRLHKPAPDSPDRRTKGETFPQRLCDLRWATPMRGFLRADSIGLSIQN